METLPGRPLLTCATRAELRQGTGTRDSGLRLFPLGSSQEAETLSYMVFCHLVPLTPQACRHHVNCTHLKICRRVAVYLNPYLGMILSEN